MSIYCTAATVIPPSCIRLAGPSGLSVIDTHVPSSSSTRRQTFRYIASWALEDPEYVGPLDLWVDTAMPGCELPTATCTTGDGTRFSRIRTPLDELDISVEGRYINSSWAGGSSGATEPWERAVLAYVDNEFADCGALTATDLDPAFFEGTSYLFPNGAATDCF